MFIIRFFKKLFFYIFKTRKRLKTIYFMLKYDIKLKYYDKKLKIKTCDDMKILLKKIIL